MTLATQSHRTPQTRTGRCASYLLFVLLVLGAFSTSTAASPLPGDIEVTGLIEALGTSSLTVQGQTFEVTDQTRIRDENNQPIPFSALTIGTLVEVEGRLDAAGALVATKIDIEDGDDDDGHEIESEGAITALTDSTLTVAGLSFTVTAATRIEASAPIQFSDLMLGQRVKVKGRMTAANGLVATRIRLRDGNGGGDHDDDDAEVHGLIQDLTETSLTVAGRVFGITAQTVVIGHNHQPLPISSLAVGQRVEVHGRIDATGVLVATRIEIEDLDEGEIELRGAIESLGADALTVSGVEFGVTDQTIVLDRNRLPIGFADLAVGMVVEVRGQTGPTGATVATRIQIEDGPDDEIELRASLDTVADSVVVALGRAFVVGATTQITSNSNQPIPFSALASGQVVEIRARRDADGTLRALTIQQEDGTGSVVRLRALVTAVGADSLDVLDVRFGAATAVVIRRDGSAGTLADLAVGQSVDVLATREATGGLTATSIRILRSARATGFVSAPTAGTFVLPGVLVGFTSATLVVDESGAQVSSSQIASGVGVRVYGTTSSTGLLVAGRIEVLASSAPVAADAPADALTLAIERVFPNPAVQTATVRYSLANGARVSVQIVDVLGRTVRELAEADQSAGTHSATLPTDGLPSGRYLVRLTVEGQATAAQAITVLR